MLDHLITILTAILVVLHWGIIVGLGMRIILKRRATGVSLAWLLLITTVPYAGALVYLLVGELWLPQRRIKQALSRKQSLRDIVEVLEDRWELTDDQLPELARGLNAQSNVPLGLSALSGNSLELHATWDECFQRLQEDIDQASEAINMVFFIWQSDGLVETIEEALMRASKRGVQCRLLLDSAGCRKFLKSTRAREMRQAGIEILEALPVGLLRFKFKRIDIRNHRKIVVIDHKIGYTGSLNMADPEHFNVGKGVGKWIDVMARVEGPAAKVLDLTMALDWAIEDTRQQSTSTDQLLSSIRNANRIHAAGQIAAQIVPSGPDQAAQLIHQMLITLIYNTRKRLVITTPYFIPSEAMLEAITGAALRGVRVTLVVPKRVDSMLVRHASKAYFEDLLRAGVEICQYRGGLLHSKTVSADDDVAMLGSVNMDKRSFSINFEISMFIYDQGFVREMRSLQQDYIAQSDRLESATWGDRGVHERIVQNAVQLLAPIL
jgi:cardiolipin synthase